MLVAFWALAFSVFPFSMAFARVAYEDQREISGLSQAGREYVESGSQPMPFAVLKRRAVVGIDSSERVEYRWLGPFAIEVGTTTTSADIDIITSHSSRDEYGVILSVLLVLLPMTALLGIGALLSEAMGPRSQNGVAAGAPD